MVVLVWFVSIVILLANYEEDTLFLKRDTHVKIYIFVPVFFADPFESYRDYERMNAHDLLIAVAPPPGGRTYGGLSNLSKTLAPGATSGLRTMVSGA